MEVENCVGNSDGVTQMAVRFSDVSLKIAGTYVRIVKN